MIESDLNRKWPRLEESVFWAVGVVASLAFLWVFLAKREFENAWIFGVILFAWGAAGRIFALQKLAAVKLDFEKKSMVDESTGALSKSRLLDAMDREMKSARRKTTAVSVVLIEAVNITEINQKFDRIEGDSSLAAVAMASQKCLRDTDYLGRTGGLIFCALLPETDEPEAFVVVKRITDSVEDIARSHPKGVVHVKCRLVAATWNPAEDVASFLARAESKLSGAIVIESHGDV